MSDVPVIDRVLKYANMQRNYYDPRAARDPEDVVGSYEYHENVPYETFLLFKHGDIRKPIFDDFSNRSAFDICCGEGRMVRRMKSFFPQVDGGDLSIEMLKAAQERTPDSNFYLTSGFDCGKALSNNYDFVYCTISLQHICVYSTRDKIIQDVCRILKPGGKATFQFLFSKFYPFFQVGGIIPVQGADYFAQVWRLDSQHAKWMDEKADALSTNSGCDVVIGTDELSLVKSYFEQYFTHVEFWFHDISIGRGNPRVLSLTHPNSHLDDSYIGTHFIFIHLDGLKG